MSRTTTTEPQARTAREEGRTAVVAETYADLMARQRADAADGLFAAVRRLGWSAERLAADREQRLRALLAGSAERCAFHRERLAGIDFEHFTEADLPSLPTMTKADLMANFDGAVSDPALTLDVVNAHVDNLDEDSFLLDQYRVVATSGTTGARGLFVYGWQDWITFALLGARWWGREGDGVDGNAVVGATFAANTRHLSGSLLAFFGDSSARGGPPVAHFPATMALPEIVAGFNAAQPVVLQGYPSSLHLLALEAMAGRLSITPKRIQASGEQCTAEARAAVREAWGLEIFDWFACSEGIHAVPCAERDGMHLPDDVVIIEPVDRDGNPVAPGERAHKILLTNLYNRTQPLIRYELTDTMTVTNAPCACGCAHRRITDLAGRTDSFFLYEGGAAIHWLGMTTVLLSDADVVELQVTQTPRGADISIATKGHSDIEGLRRGLVDLMLQAGLADPQVTIREVDALDRLWSGKLRQFQPL